MQLNTHVNVFRNRKIGNGILRRNEGLFATMTSKTSASCDIRAMWRDGNRGTGEGEILDSLFLFVRCYVKNLSNPFPVWLAAYDLGWNTTSAVMLVTLCFVRLTGWF